MFASHSIPYSQTNSFSKIVLDYLADAKELRPYYSLPVSVAGFQKAIQQKKAQSVDRKILVEVLTGQYKNVSAQKEVIQNIQSLLSSDTFTVCTAHQPNLFTGPLYFIYKILHAIKLADHLKKELPDYHFIPVFYMGSEDADFAELNHFTVDGKKYEWQTNQKGAVGRMVTDKKISALLSELQEQIGVEPYGNEITGLLKECYQDGNTIQDATFNLINKLFGKYGLLVLIADEARLKKQMLPVFTDDLFHNKPKQVVEETGRKLSEKFTVQATPREINLFYLKEGIRERIEKKNDRYSVVNTELLFSQEELKQELSSYPQRFSPNVILRGLYQETILPNIAFIGGGGELAYWLQLKDLFENYGVAFPVLLLRNSFLIVETKWRQKIEKLGLSAAFFFQSENELMNLIVERNSAHNILLNGKFEKMDDLFEQIQKQAEDIDPSLVKHVAAIKTRAIKNLQELEKKMLRAEKRKFSDEQRQIQKIKNFLFPANGLQERVENSSGYYAKWGSGFIEELYKNSPALQQEFTILTQTQ